MVFAHDSELAITGAAALVNTEDGDGDELGTLDALGAFLRRWEWTLNRDPDGADLASIQDLRPRFRELWELDEHGIAERINAMLREANAMPQLAAHDGWGYHLHVTTDDASLADRILAETAMAFLDVVRLGELERLRHCAAEDCGGVLVDLTRNRARRFCSTACGNRTHVAAYRERQEEAG